MELWAQRKNVMAQLINKRKNTSHVYLNFIFYSCGKIVLNLL